ncbi:MAG: response regulator [Erythrobacter sp.]|uniref:response regulator n=1 Tax=Erythrobacter sp. TaxID=1042 RepID=UPI002B48BC57|nr:response regulator [Erythrobacter sp.]WRH70671.1 MAG: response regulator [Erythrobacter sp.]
MQNLIKRNSGPHRRTGMEGKTLAEKLAAGEKAREAAQGGTAAPVVAEVEAAPAPAADTRAEMQARAPAAPGPESGDTDSIVAAAKAMRDRFAGSVAPAAVAKTCLIVDDSRVIRKVSSKIAISLGYVAIEAENGEEALARCKKAMPDLVLTDWNMPEMDGIEFVAKLRAIPTPKEPIVVFCTSNGEAKDIHEGISAGADDYIVKPFDEAALRAKLEKLGRG